MKSIRLFLLLVVFQVSVAQSETTTIYLIRHAEKAKSSQNPELSEEGLKRAVRWAKYFQKIKIDFFYTTLTRRTQMTCSTIATSKQKDMIFYDTSNFSLKEIIEKHPGKTILLVGHSNTIPKMINRLLEEEIYLQINENEYGILFTITIDGAVIKHKMSHHK